MAAATATTRSTGWRSVSAREASDRALLRAAGRSGRRAIAGGLLIAALAGAALSLGAGPPPAPARRAPYLASFPAGAGRAIAERACLFCHSAMLVTQQAKDSIGWEKSLATMEKWGAPVSATEHDTLRGWLLERFGPRAPAMR